MSIVSFADIQGHNYREKEVEVPVSLVAADEAEPSQLIEHIDQEIVGQTEWER